MCAYVKYGDIIAIIGHRPESGSFPIVVMLLFLFILISALSHHMLDSEYSKFGYVCGVVAGD